MNEEKAPKSGNAGLPTKIDIRTADGDTDALVVEERGALAEKLGESDIQMIDLPNGMAININRFVPAQDMSLAFDPLDGKPRMVSIMLLAGENVHLDRFEGQVLFLEHEPHLLRAGRGRKVMKLEHADSSWRRSDSISFDREEGLSGAVDRAVGS